MAVVVTCRANVSTTVVMTTTAQTPPLNSFVYVPHIWSLFVGRFITILYLWVRRRETGVKSNSHSKKCFMI